MLQIARLFDRYFFPSARAHRTGVDPLIVPLHHRGLVDQRWDPVATRALAHIIFRLQFNVRYDIEHIQGLHIFELRALEVKCVVQVIEVQVHRLFWGVDICDGFGIDEKSLRTNLLVVSACLLLALDESNTYHIGLEYFESIRQQVECYRHSLRQREHGEGLTLLLFHQTCHQLAGNGLHALGHVIQREAVSCLQVLLANNQQ